MSHTVSSAFSSFPSKVRGGALTTNGYAPLTLHAVQADVEVLGFCVRVQLHLECINETSQNQRVIMVYPVPLNWQLMHCKVAYDGEDLVTTTVPNRVFSTSEAASGVGTLSSPDGRVWRVASQYIPWEMMVGTSIYAVATYHVPLPAALKSNTFEFSLPPELFPAMQRPHETVLAYNMLFQLKSQRVLKAGVTINMDVSLFHPLNGKVQLEREECLAGPQHVLAADVQYKGDTAFTLSYSESNNQMIYQPFLLRCPIAPTLEPLRLFGEVEQSQGSEAAKKIGKHAVGISFAPLRGARYGDDVNAELVFILDSHSLESSAAMAEALRMVLPGLPSTVYLNAVFPRDNGDDAALFIDGSQPLDRVDITQLTTYVAELTPQRPGTGSTRVPVVVEALLREHGGRGCGPVPFGYARNIIIISDEGQKAGSVGAGLVRSAVREAHKVRISAVGLTFSSTTEVPVLSLLARETGGVYQEAAVPEVVSEALVRVVAAAAVPTLTNIQVAIPTEEEEVNAPIARRSFGERIPVIPTGQQRHLYLLLSEKEEAAEEGWSNTLRVVVTGRVGSALCEFNAECPLAEAPFVSNAKDEAPGLSLGLLHLTAAAARMVHLVDPDVGRGAALTKEAVDEVKVLAITASLPSPFTAMTQEASNIPIVAAQTPAHMVAASYVSVTAAYAPLLEDHQKLLYAYDNGKKPLRPSEKPIAACMPCTRYETEAYVRSLVMELLANALNPADVHRLIPMQARNGSFALTAVFATCIGATKAFLEEEKPSECAEHPEWWATALALAAARSRASPLTVLLERQAERFLRQECTNTAELLDWKGWVEAAAAAIKKGIENKL